MGRRHRHTASNYLFSEVPNVKVPRSVFPRTSTFSCTLNADYLVPVYFDEFYPGDTINLQTSALIRLNSAPVVPIMDDIYLSIEYFAVPIRICWNHWINFNGERELIDEVPNYTIPQLNSGSSGFAFESLADYFGIRPGIANLSVNALPFRVYNKVYNYWYRDENLINPVDENMADTGDTIAMYPLRKRAKVHDYFTSALPSPQKGPAATIPIVGNAPVVGNNETLVWTNGSTDYGTYYHKGSAWRSVSADSRLVNSAPGSTYPGESTSNQPGDGQVIGLSSNKAFGTAILENIAGVTINSLRQLVAVQRVSEKDMRGGTRYPEMIQTHFGVTSPDARQQRPELLYAQSARMFVNPVVQNSATNSGDTPQGNLAAYVVGSSHSKGFVKSFTEHTYVIGLASIRTSNKYQQGIPRIFSRKTRFDFYLPAFSHLGEQAILNKEIYAQGTDADEDVFGYQERWSELKYRNSIIAGKLRSDYSQSLDVWHLAQQFTSLPALNQNFIESNVPIARITSVNPEQESAFILDCHFVEKDARPMPLYSVPGLMDHY